MKNKHLWWMLPLTAILIVASGFSGSMIKESALANEINDAIAECAEDGQALRMYSDDEDATAECFGELPIIEVHTRWGD